MELVIKNLDFRLIGDSLLSDYVICGSTLFDNSNPKDICVREKLRFFLSVRTLIVICEVV